MLSILARHRLTALTGIALVAGSFVVSLTTASPWANAAALPANSNTMTAMVSYAPIVSVDKPAVVTIISKRKPTNVAYNESAPMQGNTPFDEQFRQFFSGPGMPTPQQQDPDQDSNQPMVALGSGFIVDSNGLIVTNNHVVEDSTEIQVVLDDGTQLPATLVGRDPKTDLAVVSIKAPKPLPTVAWGNSDALKVGDPVLAIGNPFGIGTTVTSGIVSARGRDLNNGPYDDFIQIDAPINHGNSGGPLVDNEGKVVGINTAIYSPNGGSVGVGFAIPSDEAQTIVAKLIKNGSIEHGVIGVMIQPVTDDVADALGLKKVGGALIDKVEPGSPAEQAGVKSGDVVVAINDLAIKSTKDLSRAVADMSPGDKGHLTIWRNGESRQLSVRIGGDATMQQAADEASKTDRAPDLGKQKLPAIGLGLGDLTGDVRQALNLAPTEKGAVVASVNPNGTAAEAGMQVGDVILSVNQRPVKSASEGKNAVAEAGKSGRKTVLLQIARGDSESFVAVPFSMG